MHIKPLFAAWEEYLHKNLQVIQSRQMEDFVIRNTPIHLVFGCTSASFVLIRFWKWANGNFHPKEVGVKLPFFLSKIHKASIYFFICPGCKLQRYYGH